MTRHLYCTTLDRKTLSERLHSVSLLKLGNFYAPIQPEEGDIALISFPLKDWGCEAYHKESSHLGSTRYTEIHSMYIESCFFFLFLALDVWGPTQWPLKALLFRSSFSLQMSGPQRLMGSSGLRRGPTSWNAQTNRYRNAEKGVSSTSHQRLLDDSIAIMLVAMIANSGQPVSTGSAAHIKDLGKLKAAVCCLRLMADCTFKQCSYSEVQSRNKTFYSYG